MYSLNNIDFELKLEPILNLMTNCVIGFEALSRSVDGSVDNERFFCSLESDELLKLLIIQFTIFQKLNSQDKDLYRAIFINISPELLEIDTLWMEFIPFAYHFSINVEIDAKKLNQLGGVTAFYNLTRLRELGVRFWIDDLDDAMWNGMLWSGFDWLWMNFIRHLTGVKFDKNFFWICVENKREQSRLTSLISTLKNKYELLVEGVESKSLMITAKTYGFEFGQGYYWKDILLNIKH